MTKHIIKEVSMQSKQYYDPWFQVSMKAKQASMAEWLFETADQYPDQLALYYQNNIFSYKDLKCKILESANILNSLNLNSDSIINICLPNIPQTIFIFYAANLLGINVSMIHPLSPPKEIFRIMNQTSSNCLFITDLYLEKYQEAIQELIGKQDQRFQIISCSPGDELRPPLKQLYQIKNYKVDRALKNISATEKWKNLQKIDTSKKELQADKFAPMNSSSIYLQSGGTSGEAKAIELKDSQFNALAIQTEQILRNSEDTFIREDHTMITVLPLFHGFGLCMGMHAPLVNGISCILIPQFSPEAIAKVIKKHRPGSLAAVPTLLEGLLHNENLAKQDLSSIKSVFCGGDTLNLELKERFDKFLEDRFSGAKIREGYGLTETVTVCSVSPYLKNKAGSVGLPLANVEMKIIDLKSGETLGPNQDGEICISGDIIMEGYLNDPEATDLTIKSDQNGKKWVHSGDLGYFDQDGYYYFKQRIKRIIKVSGIPILPSEIENILMTLPELKAVAAFSIAHTYKVHALQLAVVLQNNSKIQPSEVENKIRQLIKENFLPHANPEKIHFVDELPKTKVGKIDINKLESIYSDEISDSRSKG